MLTPYWFSRVPENIKVDRRSGCWLWTGFVTASGYGCFKIWSNGFPKFVWASRLTYSYVVSSLQCAPRTLQVDHLCRNRSCCNPAHLELVRRDENHRRRRLSRRAHRALIAVVAAKRQKRRWKTAWAIQDGAIVPIATQPDAQPAPKKRGRKAKP